MTRAKAADIAQALTNLGYAVTVIPSSVVGEINQGWSIAVIDSNGAAAQTLATFAANQAVIATVKSVVFS